MHVFLSNGYKYVRAIRSHINTIRADQMFQKISNMFVTLMVAIRKHIKYKYAKTRYDSVKLDFLQKSMDASNRYTFVH